MFEKKQFLLSIQNSPLFRKYKKLTIKIEGGHAWPADLEIISAASDGILAGNDCANILA